MPSQSNSGNVLFLILIAAALFAALSYIVLNSERAGSANIDREKTTLETGRLDSYTAAINLGLMRLSIKLCQTIDYTPPAYWVAGDKQCHLFHPDGGGVIFQDIDMADGTCKGTSEPWTSMNVGDYCGSITYAGSYGGARIYTTLTDMGTAQWKTIANATAVATLNAAGLGGTGVEPVDPVVAAEHPAAAMCASLGSRWRLPTRFELPVVYTERNTGVLSGTFSSVRYWTISPNGGGNAFRVDFSTGVLSGDAKTSVLRVRCVRND